MTKVKMKEKPIQDFLLDYLDSIPNGAVFCINRGGKPVKTKSGHIIMIPFGSKYSKDRMSDILFVLNGMTHFFETKTPEEYKYIEKHIARLLQKYPDTNKKQTHIVEQYFFIRKIINAGGKGGFVSNQKQVKDIIWPKENT